MHGRAWIAPLAHADSMARAATGALRLFLIAHAVKEWAGLGCLQVGRAVQGCVGLGFSL